MVAPIVATRVARRLPLLFSTCARNSQSKSAATMDNSHDSITRVLFCGPHFPASQNYTRDYLQKYPFIQSSPEDEAQQYIMGFTNQKWRVGSLKTGGFKARWKVDDLPLEEVPNFIDKYHICVVKNLRMEANLIGRAKHMKLIMQFGVGLEGVDIDAASNRGIKVAKIPGDVTGNSASCAEMAIYLMLGLLRKQKEMDITVKQRRLGEPAGETLLGKTVFIVGFGNIGIDLAKRLRGFGVTILATKRTWPQSNGENNRCSAENVKFEDVNDLVDKKGGPEHMYDFAKEADIVVTCLALNKETVGIVNTKFLSSMKQGSLLVNIARGGLLDYDSVSHFLEIGHLGGLGIDVAWREPFDPEDPILTHPNVLITPHVAGVTEYAYRTMAKVVGDTALQLHAGKELTEIEFVN